MEPNTELAGPARRDAAQAELFASQQPNTLPTRLSQDQAGSNPVSRRSLDGVGIPPANIGEIRAIVVEVLQETAVRRSPFIGQDIHLPPR